MPYIWKNELVETYIICMCMYIIRINCLTSHFLIHSERWIETEKETYREIERDRKRDRERDREIYRKRDRDW